ncbi:secretory subunit [Marasmius sp. AFHP31]|nr:secretory subunit [Marasmius sp. AFHP31]
MRFPSYQRFSGHSNPNAFSIDPTTVQDDGKLHNSIYLMFSFSMHSLTPSYAIGSLPTVVYACITRALLPRLAQFTGNESFEVSIENASSRGSDIDDLATQLEQKGYGGTGDMKKAVDKQVEVDRFAVAGGSVHMPRQIFHRTPPYQLHLQPSTIPASGSTSISPA